MSLNDSQQLAVETTEGPLLILAGAGSGKTTVLKHRVAHLIEKNVPSEQILVVSFTKDAATEMKTRLNQFLTEVVADKITVKTFHSFGLSILREFSSYLSFTNSRFTILDETESKKIIYSILKKHPHLGAFELPVDIIQGYISALKSELIDPDSILFERTTYPFIDFDKSMISIQKTIPDEHMPFIKDFYAYYQEMLAQSSYVDFDDLIMLPVIMFHNYPFILEKYQEQFRYIMIDEYQDTNFAQYALMRMLSSKYKNIAVVGDDFQAIYGWRGAEIQNILQFDQDFPEAQVIILQENYRSTPTIINAANEVIKNNIEQKQKVLFTNNADRSGIGFYRASSDYDEARYVVNKIQDLLYQNVPFHEIAVLCRTNFHLELVVKMLNRKGIPTNSSLSSSVFFHKDYNRFYQFLSFIDNVSQSNFLTNAFLFQNHILSLDVMEDCLYTLQENQIPFEWNWFYEHISHVYLGKQDEHRDLCQNRNLCESCSFYSFLSSLSQIEINNIYRRSKLIHDLNIEKDKPLTHFFTYLFCNTDFLFPSSSFSTQKEKREQQDFMMNFMMFAHTFEQEYGTVTLNQFLDTMNHLKYAENESNQKGINILTVHASKGLEYEYVFLIAFEDGVFPHKKSLFDNNIEEERRLFYVAITRAKIKLFISYARFRKGVQGNKEQIPSRFLFEISEDLFEVPYRQVIDRQVMDNEQSLKNSS